MTNDKLAEAIAWMEAMQIPRDDRIPDQGKVYRILEAARLYHDLPVVDLEKLKDIEDPGFDPWQDGNQKGYNQCLEYLRTTYPKGVRWK